MDRKGQKQTETNKNGQKKMDRNGRKRRRNKERKMSCVTWHVFCVKYPVSRVMCHVSPVTYPT